ncbi:MAG: hypothetical protein M1436_08725, partial [Acidobacteria bacterium]|nr:hypothetical protein [Acidobacteriota bacterium]
VARWPVAPAAANFPMALDEAGGRLFVGCRNPPEVLVMETHAGRILARFRCPGDADDLFYDAARKRIYVTGGDGTLAVFDNQYRQVSSIVTAGGARTSLWVAAVNRLFVAVPHRGNQGAGVWVLKAE